MNSIRTIYKIGNGPSSSHTMAPKVAASIFIDKNKSADYFKVELYGSLASTGKGHLTDYILYEILGKERTEIKFCYGEELPYHPNGMKFFAYQNEQLLDEWEVYSIGGGEIYYDGQIKNEENVVYPQHTMSGILKYCEQNDISLYQYIIACEGEEILEFVSKVFDQMVSSIKEGLQITGVLPGRLNVNRRANAFYLQYQQTKKLDALVFASALAASEMNASGGVIVTAPTCGACGVLPGVLYPYYLLKKYSKQKIVESLLIAGLIGNLIRTNASISGACVGCQGEIGAACSMASAAVCYLYGGSSKQIEYAAEIGLEHYLGMTCDPVGGYVQIPCIERNAISSKKAIDCAIYASLSNGEHYITLDHVIKTMMKTGQDIQQKYRETSLGGLAVDD